MLHTATSEESTTPSPLQRPLILSFHPHLFQKQTHVHKCVTDFCRPDATSTNRLKALKVILTMNKYQSNLAKNRIVYMSPLATANGFV